MESEFDADVSMVYRKGLMVVMSTKHLCSDKKDVLITHLEALGAMSRETKVKQKELQEVGLVAIMKRIVSGEETSEEIEARKEQQRINFMDACKGRRGGKFSKLVFAEIALALEYGVTDATSGLHAMDFKKLGDQHIEILSCSLEALIIFGADARHKSGLMSTLCQAIQSWDDRYHLTKDQDDDKGRTSCARIRDKFIRVAELLIRHGANIDCEFENTTPRELLGDCIDLLVPALEERERWVARRGLVLLLEGLNTTTTSTTATPLPPCRIASCHRNNKSVFISKSTYSAWCCCEVARLRKSLSEPAVPTSASTVSASKAHSRLSPIDRVIANSDLTKNIVTFL